MTSDYTLSCSDSYIGLCKNPAQCFQLKTFQDNVYLFIIPGDVITYPSVDRDVEQYHVITELLDGKNLYCRKSNSTMDFQQLQCKNPASKEYDDFDDSIRSSTLPKGFKFSCK